MWSSRPGLEAKFYGLGLEGPRLGLAAARTIFGTTLKLKAQPTTAKVCRTV